MFMFTVPSSMLALSRLQKKEVYVDRIYFLLFV